MKPKNVKRVLGQIWKAVESIAEFLILIYATLEHLFGDLPFWLWIIIILLVGRQFYDRAVKSQPIIVEFDEKAVDRLVKEGMLITWGKKSGN